MATETRYYLYDAPDGQELLARVDDIVQGIAFLFREGEWHRSKSFAKLVTGMGGDTGYTDMSEAEARRRFPEAFAGSPVTFDRDLFARALDFAARVHGGQKVPGSKFPYVVHVAKVAMEVLAATEGE